MARYPTLVVLITNSTVDWSQLDPMVTATICELERAGVRGWLETAIGNTQYRNEAHMDEVIANKHVQVLIPPDSGTRETPRPGWTGGRCTWMRYVFATELGAAVPQTLALGAVKPRPDLALSRTADAAPRAVGGARRVSIATARLVRWLWAARCSLPRYLAGQRWSSMRASLERPAAPGSRIAGEAD